jgi:GNAT superfamily N-acetyltransferase
MVRIAFAESVADIERCFPVISQLRPHLAREDFPGRVQRQHAESGYQLVYLEDESEVKAVAGFRVAEYLAWGKTLYVDDLVTDAAARSQGYGGRLFDWLVAYARAQGCDQLHLDSGVQRFGAHRFYLQKRMHITSHHFALDLRNINPT